MRQSKTTLLESALSLIPDLAGTRIEFRPYRGWYLLGDPRWLGDSGADLIGKNYHEAAAYLAGFKKAVR